MITFIFSTRREALLYSGRTFVESKHVVFISSSSKIIETPSGFEIPAKISLSLEPDSEYLKDKVWFPIARRIGALGVSFS